MRKTIVLTSFPPEGGGGGGVVIRSLFEKIPADRFAWYSLNVDITAKINWRRDVLRAQFPFHKPGRNHPLLHSFYTYIFFIIELVINFIKLNALKKKIKAELLWVVIDKDNITQYYILLKLLKLPYHVSIHDDPEVSLALVQKKISHISKFIFAKILYSAKSSDCISLQMVDYYKTNFNLSSVWLHKSISREDLNLNYHNDRYSSFLKEFVNGEINVILSGWGDCLPPWPKVLVDALDIFEERYNVKIRLFSFDPSLAILNNSKVTICSKLTAVEFDLFIKKMHIGYAPDNLNIEYRLFAQTSLSTKMLTYILNCMPSLYHGPIDSSIGHLFSEANAGIIVDCNDSVKIADAFFELCLNYSNYKEAAYRLAEKYFLEDDMHLKLNRLLD